MVPCVCVCTWGKKNFSTTYRGSIVFNFELSNVSKLEIFCDLLCTYKKYTQILLRILYTFVYLLSQVFYIYN